MTIEELVVEIKKNMACNCDLDNWEPTRTTGHSCVCRIHNKAMELSRLNDENVIKRLAESK